MTRTIACPLRSVSDLLGLVPVPPAEKHLLPEDSEVRLVRGQTQHDQVGVQAVQDVPRVGVIAGLKHPARAS